MIIIKAILTEADKKRFLNKVNKSDNISICWEWVAKTVDKDGYGRMYLHGKHVRSNRIAYVIHYNDDPLERLVCHSCDNPRCCNPSHLFLGTAKENTNDSVRKGRWPSGDNHWTVANPENVARGARNGAYTKPENVGRGVTHGMAKLTSDDILQIRKRYKSGGITQTKLSKEYGVSQVNISCIILNKNWAHIHANL